MLYHVLLRANASRSSATALAPAKEHLRRLVSEGRSGVSGAIYVRRFATELGLDDADAAAYPRYPTKPQMAAVLVSILRRPSSTEEGYSEDLAIAYHALLQDRFRVSSSALPADAGNSAIAELGRRVQEDVDREIDEFIELRPAMRQEVLDDKIRQNIHQYALFHLIGGRARERAERAVPTIGTVSREHEPGAAPTALGAVSDGARADSGGVRLDGSKSRRRVRFQSRAPTSIRRRQLSERSPFSSAAKAHLPGHEDEAVQPQEQARPSATVAVGSATMLAQGGANRKRSRASAKDLRFVSDRLRDAPAASGAGTGARGREAGIYALLGLSPDDVESMEEQQALEICASCPDAIVRKRAQRGLGPDSVTLARDRRTLMHQMWVNDAIITAWGEYLEDRYGPRRVKTVPPQAFFTLERQGPGRRGLRDPATLLSYSVVLWPINLSESHWLLLVLVPRHRMVLGLNTLPSAYTDEILNRLTDWLNRLTMPPPSRRFVHAAVSVTRQDDASSCGIYVMAHMLIVAAHYGQLIRCTASALPQTLQMLIRNYMPATTEEVATTLRKAIGYAIAHPA